MAVPNPTSRRRRAFLVCPTALTALVVGACGSGGGSQGGTPEGETGAATTTSAAPLPTSEDITTLDALTVDAQPFPDFALTIDDTVWISGVEPGIVGYDATTGEVRTRTQTDDVPLAMEQGFGSLWAGEGSGAEIGTVVRVDSADGTVLARVPMPSPGLRPESSIAVTEDAVWALVDGDDAESRLLVAIDPVTNGVRDTFPAPRAAEALRGGFGSLWVATSQQSVVRVDPADGSVEATVETGSGSRFMTVGEDAVWVINQDDGTVSRIDPETDTVVATIQVSQGRIPGGDIAAGDGAVWVRTESELATAIDVATGEVVRVLGPATGSGSIAVTPGAVWITAHDVLEVYRIPTG
jgi:YVTN family beta-propeller protein